jgi:hypothetical protein
MNQRPIRRLRLSGVFVYALAMAWVESAVVFYLRTMVNRIDPYQANPLPVVGTLGAVELVREAATLVMLLAVGLLTGRTWRARWGYAAFAFGVWDLFYYVFLKVICGWPHSLLDWDVLFLLPLPWWGPVLAPICIALLMVIWGVLASREDANIGSASPVVSPVGMPPRSGFRLRQWTPWVLNTLGICLALGVFMEDSLRVSGQGEEVVRRTLPRHFQWPLFGLALMLMAAPIFPLCGLRGRDTGGRTLHGCSGRSAPGRG